MPIVSLVQTNYHTESIYCLLLVFSTSCYLSLYIMHYSHIGIVYASRMRHIEAIRNIEMCELTYLSCSQIFVNETKNIEAICVFGVPLSIIFLHTTNLLELLLLSLPYV